MKSIDKNEPAFPLYCGQDDSANTSGMTLRDYFAAKAMQKLMELPINEWPDFGPMEMSISRAAYKMADAMLEARK